MAWFFSYKSSGLAKRNFGNDAFVAPTVDQGNPVVVVDVEDQGENEAQAQHEDIIEPGDLPQFDLVHHLGFQALVPGHQPVGQLLDDVPGQLRIMIQEAVEFLLGDLDEAGSSSASTEAVRGCPVTRATSPK